MRLHQKLFLLLVFSLPVQIGRHFWPQWSYILGLRVDYLSPTVYLTDILVLVILLLWGIEKLKTQNSKFKSKSNILKLLIFPTSVFLLLLVNCFFAQNQGVAFYKLAKIVEFSLLGFYVVKNHYSLFTIRYSLIGAVIYSSLIAFAQFINQSSLGGVFWWLGERTFNVATPGIAKTIINGELIMRPYGTFPHPNVLAGFVLVSLILIGVRCQMSGVRKILHWLAIVLGIVAIAISFSRSAWLVGLFAGLWALKCLRVNVLRVACYVLLSLAVTLLLFKLPNFADEAFLQRIELNRISFQLIKEQSLIGIGLNNFIVRLPEFWQRIGQTYWLQPVHNIFLLIATETGIIGLLIFLWFLFLTYKHLRGVPQAQHHLGGGGDNYQLSIALSAILALGFFDHYWLTLQQTQLLFVIVLGLAWAKK